MDNHTTPIECDDELTLTQQQTVVALSWWLDIVAYIIIGIIGLTLNILAVGILLTPTMWNNFFNRLIMCLSAYDNLFILCGLLEILRKWQKTSIQQYLFAKLLYPFRSMAMCCSIYTTMVLTLERYQAITSPIAYRNRNASLSLGKRLFTYIVPVMLFSFIYYTPKFFDLYLEEVTECGWKNQSSSPNNNSIMVKENGTECLTELRIYPTDLRIHQQYIFWYLNVSNLIVTCLIPIGLLMFLNCRIVSALQEYRRRRPIGTMKDNDSSIKNKECTRQNNKDVKQTFILFSIVILFVVCHALRIVMNITEIWNLDDMNTQGGSIGCEGMSFWQHVSIPFSEILLLFNSSANFFVFMFFDKAFQLVLKETFSSFKQCFTTSNTPQRETIPLNPKPQRTQEMNENDEVNEVKVKEVKRGKN